MLTNSRAIIQRLEQDGFILLRVSGSHHIFYRSQNRNLVIVPHPRKDLPKGTVRNIYKKAGWQKD